MSGTSACRAGMSNDMTPAERKPISMICQRRTTPSEVSTARSSARIPTVDWVTSSSRRRSTRSAITPAKREKAITGTAREKATIPSQNGELVSCRTSQPCPIICIQVPMLETSSPNQSRRKSRTRRASNIAKRRGAAVATPVGVSIAPATAGGVMPGRSVVAMVEPISSCRAGGRRLKPAAARL